MNNFHIDFTNPAVLIGAVVIVLVIVALIAFAMDRRRKRREALRRRFGAEYELTVQQHGADKADALLLDRVQRVERFKLRELTATERERFVAQWEAVQSRFVDHPRGAVTEADELVNNVMLARGFPAAKFDQRVEDISVHHARLVDSYRSANNIALRAGRNEASTEELRTAMIHYRALFDELLSAKSASAVEVVDDRPNLRRTA